MSAEKIAEVLTGTHFIPIGGDPDVGSFLTLEGYEAEWIAAALEPVIREAQKAAWDACLASIVYPDGEPLEVILNNNPYDTKEEA